VKLEGLISRTQIWKAMFINAVNKFSPESFKLPETVLEDTKARRDVQKFDSAAPVFSDAVYTIIARLVMERFTHPHFLPSNSFYFFQLVLTNEWGNFF
jgi:aspartate carbamoyltransferase catalytic subunit